MLRQIALACAVLVPAADPADATDVTPGDALAAARAAVHYMISAEEADGHFLYQFDFLAGRFSSNDNLVRQAGAAYALSQYMFLSGDETVREGIYRALGYALVHRVAVGDGVLVSTDGTRAEARVGATGLAVLAATYQLRLEPDDLLKPTAVAWIKGLAATQLADGTFPSPPDGKASDAFASGEAWYALASWADFDPSDDVAAKALQAADGGLMAQATASPDTSFFHWGLLAAAQRYETTGDARFLDFIAAQSNTYLTMLAPKPRKGGNSCATIEGLGAGVAALVKGGRNADLVARMRGRIAVELDNVLALQIPSGTTRIDLGPDRFYADPRIASFAGGFRDGASSLSMRIDSTQHCLSALMTYRQLAPT